MEAISNGLNSIGVGVQDWGAARAAKITRSGSKLGRIIRMARLSRLIKVFFRYSNIMRSVKRDKHLLEVKQSKVIAFF